MNIEEAKKITELLKELEYLSKYKDIIENPRKPKHSIHFSLFEHYNYNGNVDFVQIPSKYTPRFVKVLKEIIDELHNELKSY